MYIYSHQGLFASCHNVAMSLYNIMCVNANLGTTADEWSFQEFTPKDHSLRIYVHRALDDDYRLTLYCNCD